VKSGWPWQGGISFKNVRMRYRDDFEPVLMNVNVDIPPGASVGIVGRTGSGKSSLFRALLRLTELERGTIAIDGVDAAAVGLDALRSGISIIPQDPVLFSGSIR
jgi:ABC-type multidrug transport system fused ATPase/permease subunit